VALVVVILLDAFAMLALLPFLCNETLAQCKCHPSKVTHCNPSHDDTCHHPSSRICRVYILPNALEGDLARCLHELSTVPTAIGVTVTLVIILLHAFAMLTFFPMLWKGI
jgi:hypothetical protein